MLRNSTVKSAPVKGVVILAGAAITLACMVFATDLQAQDAPKRMMVTFAAVDLVGDPGNVAMLIRRNSGTPRNLILLRADKATIADVAMALAALSQKQEADSGILLSAEERTTLAGGEFSTTDRSQIIRFMNILKSLRQAPVRSVRGVGKVPAIDVPLTLVSGTRERQNKPSKNPVPRVR